MAGEDEDEGCMLKRRGNWSLGSYYYLLTAVSSILRWLDKEWNLYKWKNCKQLYHFSSPSGSELQPSMEYVQPENEKYRLYTR